MMIKFICFFTLSISLFAQSEKTDFSLFYDKLDSISLKNEDFRKVAEFYKNKEFDSSYVYSGELLLSSVKKIEPYLNYIQGAGALRKNFYIKAYKSFNNIPEGTSFDNLKLIKLGYCLLNMGKYEEAIHSYLKWESKNHTTGLSMKKHTYHNLGICYIYKKDYKLAKRYFDKEFRLIGLKDTLSIIRSKIDNANVYYNQYLDKEAIPLFKEGYDLAILYSDLHLKQQAAENMAVVEKNGGNYKESVRYYLESNKWKDSLNNRDRIWELTEKDKQIAVAQKQKEISVQDEKLKRQKVQRDSLIIGAASLLLFIVGLGFFYKKLQNQNTLIMEQKLALTAVNKTKDYLFSVVSHDLRSPINTIKRQHKELNKHIKANDLEAITIANNKAIAITDSTSHLLNNVLHWSLEQSDQLMFSLHEIALKPVIEHVVFDYKTIATANNVSLNVVLQNAMVHVDKESLKIVLRNVLDNAIKYGGNEIEISTGVSSNKSAFIAIKDNGSGMSDEVLNKVNSLANLSVDKIDRSQGIGLGVVLCHTLVKKNKGVLTFISEPNKGTTVRIELQNVPV